MKKSPKNIVQVVMCIILICTWICVCGQKDSENVDLYLDSLVSLLPNMPDSSEKLKILDEINMEHYNVDSIFKYATMELGIADSLGVKLYIASANRYLGWSYHEMEEYEKASSCFLQSIRIFDSISFTTGLASCYYALGSSFCGLGDDIKTEEYYRKSMALYDSLKRYDMVSEICRKIALVRMDYHLYESSKSYLDRAFDLDTRICDTLALSTDYFALGWVDYRHYKDVDNAYFLNAGKDKMRMAFDIDVAYENLYEVNSVSNELMYVYHDLAKLKTGNEKIVMLDSARFFYNISDSLLPVFSSDKSKIYLDLWLATDFAIKGNVDDALKLLNEIESRPNLNWENKLYLFDAFIYTYESTNDYANVLKYVRLKNNIDREKYNRNFAVRATSSEFERELAQQNMIQQKQRYTLLILKLCLGLALLILLVFLYGLMRKRKLNKCLALQNNEIAFKNANLNESNAEILAQREEIEAQRDSLEETSQMLQSSINYAKHIQDGVMISIESMHRMFGDTLIYWKPMNVVSGDFYWAMQKGNFKLLVLADCTGHGVPGAFMSMFTISSLNSIVSPLNFENFKASDVLDLLRAKVIGELHQTSTNGDSIESVDMAFCIIDTNKMQMQYAGANRPLLIVRDGDIIVYKPDKMPVGLHIIRKGPFTNNVIDLKKNDVLYMYTDGITDQFGSEGENDESGKFTTRRLDNLLLNIVDKPFAEQADIVDRTLTGWRTMPDKTVIDQYDDQLLLGVRIS